MPRRPYAGLILVLLLQAHPALAADATEQAKEHFDKGVELFKNDDFSGALVEFRAAYKAQPHFAVRYNVGITLYKLQRYGDAHAELTAYLEEGAGQIPDDKSKEVEDILSSLKSLLGTLTVKTAVDGATLLVDGKVASSWSVTLEVGEHSVEVRAPGHEAFLQVVELPGGESVIVEAVLEELVLPSRKKLRPAGFWAVMSVTLALGASAGVTGGLALKTKADYREMSYDDPDWKSVKDRGLTLSITTDVLLGVTGAAAITTIILAALTDFSGKESGNVSWFVAPSQSGPVIGLGGTF